MNAPIGNVYLRNLTTGRVLLASPTLPGTPPIGWGERVTLSGDGVRVAWESTAPNLVPGDTNLGLDVFVFDRASGSVVRASVDSSGAQANGRSFWPRISRDGSAVAFESWANNLVPGDTNSITDVFVHDLSTGLTSRISVDSSGQQANCGMAVYCADSLGLSISADGNLVAFTSGSSQLVNGDTNLWTDVFVRDRAAGTTERVSVATGGGQGNGESTWPDLSCDGRFVAFDSWSSNLVPGDTNNRTDVFVHDRVSGMTRLVSVDFLGNQGNDESTFPAISCNGRYVAFMSTANNLVPNDTNNTNDVFLHDVWASTTTLVTRAMGGLQVTSGAVGYHFSVGDDGSVAYMGGDSNISPGDITDLDVFLFRPTPPPSAIAAYCTPKTNSLGCAPRITVAGFPSMSDPATLFLGAQSVRSQQAGLMIWSQSSQTVPFAGGWLCIAAPIRRTPMQSSGGSAAPSCTGSYGFHASPLFLRSNGLLPGSTLHAQFYGRDSGFAPPGNVTLSDAVSLTVLP